MSLAGFTPSQFIRSSRASSGDAEACTPLSNVLGSSERPSGRHVSKIARRSDPSPGLPLPGEAVAGLVVPIT